MTTPAQHLFCFSFDNTIVDENFHNKLTLLGVEPGRASNSQINTLLEAHSILNQEKLLKTFKSILEKGHHLAITTWSEYPEVVAPTLRKLGLTKTEIAKVHIESGYPTSLFKWKSDHIKRAKEHFGVTDNRHVWLIDDNIHSIDHAKKEGQLGIHVKVPRVFTEYLELIETFLKDRRVKIVSLDSLEGKRLYNIRRKLQAKGYKPTAPRKDGETPLARFLAKNPPVANTEILQSPETEKPKKKVANTEKPKKNVVNAEKPKKNVVNQIDVKKTEPASMPEPKKTDLTVLCLGVAIGAGFWFLSMPLVALGTLCSTLLIEAARRLVSSTQDEAIQSPSRYYPSNPSSSGEIYKAATTSQYMTPYFKQPKASRVELDNTMNTEIAVRHSFKIS